MNEDTVQLLWGGMPADTNGGRGHHHSKKTTILIASGVGVAVLLLLITACCCYRRRKQRLAAQTGREGLVNQSYHGCWFCRRSNRRSDESQLQFSSIQSQSRSSFTPDVVYAPPYNTQGFPPYNTQGFPDHIPVTVVDHKPVVVVADPVPYASAVYTGTA